MSQELENSIQKLRDHCNNQIKMINHGLGIETPRFTIINGWLKECDKLFTVVDANKSK